MRTLRYYGQLLSSSLSGVEFVEITSAVINDPPC